MSQEIYIDINYLTESERDIVLQVLARDEELRRQEKRRISGLKDELDGLRKKGATKDEKSSGNTCARCRNPLGVVFNSGALCPKCNEKVCKLCREQLPKGAWICSLCARLREVRAESGAWFYEQISRKKGEKPKLYGSALLRASFRRSKPSSLDDTGRAEFESPPPPPVINQELKQSGLHKPIPVHMSPLKEHAVDEPEEVNRNYKPYAQAVPVVSQPRDDKPDAQAVPVLSQLRDSKPYSKAVPITRNTPGSDDEGHDKSPSSSRSATPTGTTTDDTSYYDASEQPSIDTPATVETMSRQFDRRSSSSSESEESAPTPRKLVMNGSALRNGDGNFPQVHVEDRKSGAEFEDFLENNLDQAFQSKESIPESLEGDKDEPQQNGYSHEEQRRKMQLLRAESPDSATTGEFVTPRSTPRGSGDSTPVPSEPTSDDDSQYQMASSQPEIAYDRYGVPILATQETTDGSGQQAAPKEMPAPPAIVMTSVTEEEDRFPGPGHDGNDDDIDHAFAAYGMDLNSKKLGEQLNLGSRESIVSYYSDAGDGVYGNVTVTGAIQFGLKYDFKRASLEVQIHSAREIAAVDEKKQRSDPYIKVYLLPDRTKGGKRKTKTKKHTLNPVFDEILTFKVGFEELLTRTLWLTIWNHDRFGHNEFLGEVMLPFDTYRQSGFSLDDPSPQWYTLYERLPEPSLMTYCGELELALMYRPPEYIKDKKKKKKGKGELHIRLIGAKNLPAKDANGFSDPFCKSYLLPDKSKKTKQKTQIVKKNLNPVWNYSYVYDDLTRENLVDRVLELTVWDHDRGTSNDFLGGARLGLGAGAKDWDDAQGEEMMAWQAMLDYPNEWQKATITLRSKMDSRLA